MNRACLTRLATSPAPSHPPREPELFSQELDAALCHINADYRAHRDGDLTMRAPEVCAVRRGGFAAWMRSRGKLCGQHKVPPHRGTGALVSTGVTQGKRAAGLVQAG